MKDNPNFWPNLILIVFLIIALAGMVYTAKHPPTDEELAKDTHCHSLLTC